ncbi:sulfotransferase domain-containing protein [Amorphus sp. MBR-141]
MASIPPGLVWLASYPKSGNTWMRVLLANLLAGADTPRNINDLSDDESLVGRWRFSDDTLVDPDLLDPCELKPMRRAQCDFVAGHLASPFVCKTHDRFDAMVLGHRARRALYLVRDPRDVAISLAHHASMPLDRAIGQMMDATSRSSGPLQLRYPVGDWGGHVSGWATQDLVPTTVVRYEDLHADAASSLTRIVAFLGGQAGAAEIGRAVAHSSLAELQRQEASSGFQESLPGQRRFFRSGRIGEWREVMTAAQVEAIESRFAPVMERWGYDVSGQSHRSSRIEPPDTNVL